MSTNIYCHKLKQEAEALSKPPLPGALGEKIVTTISKPAWQSWINHQTMLINEYRLSLIDPQAKQFLKEEMEKFLWGEGSAAPEGFQPVTPSTDLPDEAP